MIRKVKKLVAAYRERLVSLVLVPAFFLATMPHTACICADGHREAFCRAALCRMMGAQFGESTCCGCSCCKAGATCEKRSCCKAKHSQEKPIDTSSGAGLIAKTGSCCLPYVEIPDPGVTAGMSDLKVNSTQVTAIAPLPTLLPADTIRPTFERTHHSTPPPLDTVIVYLHLTI